MRKHGAALKLANILDRPLKPGTYRTRCLLAGIESEQDRLGSAPFLVVVWQECKDFYDSMDFLFLVESFKSLNDATRGAEESLQSVTEERMAAGWQVEAEEDPPQPSVTPCPTPSDPRHESPLRTSFIKRVKLRERPRPSFTVERLRARVVEGFTGTIVCKELFEFLGANEELRHYFIACGEAVLARKALPRPREYT